MGRVKRAKALGRYRMNKASERQDRYDKANTKKILLKLNITTDADILEQLEKVPNKQGYIKELIRKDLNK